MGEALLILIWEMFFWLILIWNFVERERERVIVYDIVLAIVNSEATMLVIKDYIYELSFCVFECCVANEI